MATKHFPNKLLEKDYLVTYSINLAIRLKSVEQAQLIDIVHKKLQTKKRNPKKYNAYFIRGCWWTCDPYKTWQENYFPFSTEQTVRLSFFKPLLESGVLVRSNFDNGLSRRSWFTIDYNKLHELYPFTEKLYPNLNEGYNAEQLNNATLSNVSNNAQQRIDTTLSNESIYYNNNYIYKTDISTLYSQERSTEKTALTESVKKENGDSDLTEIFKTFENYTGTSFDDTESMDLIKNLLQSGYSVTDLVGVIKCKADEWKDSEKMRPCIRPKTLFRTDRFSEYLETARSKGYVPKPLLPVNETLFNALSVNDQNYLTDTGCIDADFNIDFLKLRKLDNGSRTPFSLKITHAINLLSEKGDNRFSEYMFIPDSDVNTLRNIGFISENEEEGRSWLNVTDDIYERIILTYGIG